MYFSDDNGLAESRLVFLEGCGLPEAWAGRRHFTVAELGFGTGLNIAALLQLWSQCKPPSGRLNIFSVEAHLMSAGDARRALARWPEMALWTEPLLSRWPTQARGMQRIDLPEFSACLDLAILDAEAALAGWLGKADAWFLDGFSPAKNPAMWSPELLRRVAERSRPGARAATFTVAGAVRRGLGDAGFVVSRAPGFGRKRERLTASLAMTQSPRTEMPPRIAIIGAGISGMALARSLDRYGVKPLVFDRVGVGAGASGNPAALVTPRLDAGRGPAARLFAQAFAHAVQVYEQVVPAAILARGSLQLRVKPDDASRFAALAASDFYAPGTLSVLSEEEVSVKLGESVGGGLWIGNALVIDPRSCLAGLGPAVQRGSVASLLPESGGWQLLNSAGDCLAQVDQVVLAGGVDMAQLAEVPLTPVRGQVSLVATSPTLPPTAFGSYVIPTCDGLLFGATHDRGDASEDPRPEDNSRNLAQLAARLPALVDGFQRQAMSGRASVRASTPDQLPLVGVIADQPGIFVLAGFGGRGFCLAPLLADHLAALMLDRPSPLAADLSAAVDPKRFALRAARRTPNTSVRKSQG